MRKYFHVILTLSHCLVFLTIFKFFPFYAFVIPCNSIHFPNLFAFPCMSRFPYIYFGNWVLFPVVFVLKKSKFPIFSAYSKEKDAFSVKMTIVKPPDACYR